MMLSQSEAERFLAINNAQLKHLLKHGAVELLSGDVIYPAHKPSGFRLLNGQLQFDIEDLRKTWVYLERHHAQL